VRDRLEKSPDRFAAVPSSAPELVDQLGGGPRRLAPLVPLGQDGEGLFLIEREVDLKASEVRLDPGTTKNLEGRVFYLTPELKELLTAQRKAADRIQREKGMIVQHVFFHDSTTKAGAVGFWSGHCISDHGFYHAWCRARVKAGCPGSIPHDFRRTAVRNMVRAGVPERVAMKLCGHKTRSVFDRYNIVSDGDLRDAASRLALIAQSPAQTRRTRGRRFVVPS
jgi:integrase